MWGGRMDQYAAATVNRRLAAISGLFAFVAMRDPEATNTPVVVRDLAAWRSRTWSGFPMILSGRGCHDGWVGVVGALVAQHGPQHVDPPAGEGQNGVGVSFAVPSARLRV